VTDFRPTRAEIDLGALEHNFGAIKKRLSKDVKIMVVVKANAYGHGLIEVSRTLKKRRVDYLGVATVDEAMVLRKNAVKTPVLVLGSVLPGEVKPAVKNDITLTLCSDSLLKACVREARRVKKKVKVHVKVDTGMGRIGIWHEDAADFVRRAYGKKEIILEGLYTHFSIAGRDNFFTQYQIESFENFIEEVESSGVRAKYKHAANSIALIDLDRSHLNLVRPGIVIYGIYPKRNFPKLIDLKPVMSLKTRITYIKEVPPGRSISYGRTFITQKKTRIATLPVGYADGYGRILSNKAKALVRGRTAPVVGKITMDQTMIDVGHIKEAKLKDEVVLIGYQKGHRISCEELARLCGTIPYEIVTGISERVPRVYKKRSP
jgi:alanine racemase